MNPEAKNGGEIDFAPLSDVGGVDNPEEQTKIKLSAWLVEESGAEVLWEQKNNHGYKTFEVAGVSGRKPDLLVVSEDVTFAVEVKNRRARSVTYDAMFQAAGYYEDVISGGATYHAKGREVEVEGIVVGNDYSTAGGLFWEVYEGENPKQFHSSSRRWSAHKGEIPDNEKPLSEAFTRIMWRLFKDRFGSLEMFTGVLLSTALDNDEEIGQPAVLWTGENGQEWRYL